MQSGSGAQSSESLEQMFANAPRPALLAMAGLLMLGLCVAMAAKGIEGTLIVPLLLGVVGVGVSWLRFNAKDGQLWTMLGGIAVIFVAYAIYIATHVRIMQSARHATFTMLVAGLALLVGVLLAIVPWIMTLVRDLGTERALKEREEERADMTAHLHDGVLQTLALIQLHAGDQQTVFSLARQQERELREWLYQERTTSDRSVNAGLKQIAAHVEDTHGKPIEVVTVGDARPSAQTDALLDATQQALVNAVTHGGEPVSVYCEAGDKLVEVFVRDHGDGFDVEAIPANRLGIRESIIGRTGAAAVQWRLCRGPAGARRCACTCRFQERRRMRTALRSPQRTAIRACNRRNEHGTCSRCGNESIEPRSRNERAGTAHQNRRRGRP